MRTTADLDDDVAAAARALAQHEHISLGRAINALARRGMAPVGRASSTSGFPTFPAVDGHTITSDMVAEHRDDD